MAYLYKKVVGGKPYYYLRISRRVGSRVMAKDIAYLGTDPEKIAAKLDKIPRKYKEAIRQGHKAITRFLGSEYYLSKVGKLKPNPYFDLEVLREVESLRLHFQMCFLKQHPYTIRQRYEHFLINFAYNTASIEGNTITLEEAGRLLEHNLTPKDRTPREIYDLQNTQKTFFYLLEQKPEFNQETITKIHDLLLQNIDERKGYRHQDIRVVRSHFDASPGKYVLTDTKLLFQWYQKHKQALHPLVLAVLFHHKLEKIHPFYDGNGRTGRMAMNYILLERSLPPIIITRKNRASYLTALAQADQAGASQIDPKYYKLLVSFVSQELLSGYWENFGT